MLEPVAIGMIGEAAVKLGFQGVPRAQAIQQISRTIPAVNVNEYLREIAFQSLQGVESIRENLTKEYGPIQIIGKGEGRHPDLVGRVRPDFIAFKDKAPIIVETKDTTRQTPSDNFQAMYYNGIAEEYGLYLIEERLEAGSHVFFPHTVQGSAEAVLMYPRLAKYSIVKDRFVPTSETVRGIWRAKELGFKGQVPETGCGRKCAHNRLKVKLPEGDMEPLPPLPLIFSKRVLDEGFSYDMGYQVAYGWNLLPRKVKLAILFSEQRTVNGLEKLKEWLTNVVRLEEEAAEIVLNPRRREAFFSTRPEAERLVKSMGGELEPWKLLLKQRLDAGAPSILAVATAVYSLPKRSFRFMQDAWDRWH